MDRDFGPTRTIDYDFHKARAQALREQAIDRLFARLAARLRAVFGARASASPRLRSGKTGLRHAPKLTMRGAPDAHC